jgi:hypothetical protein
MVPFDRMKVADLKAELKKLGLPQQGLKAELLARLQEAVAGDGAPTAVVDPSEDRDLRTSDEPTDAFDGKDQVPSTLMETTDLPLAQSSDSSIHPSDRVLPSPPAPSNPPTIASDRATQDPSQETGGGSLPLSSDPATSYSEENAKDRVEDQTMHQTGLDHHVASSFPTEDAIQPPAANAGLHEPLTTSMNVDSSETEHHRENATHHSDILTSIQASEPKVWKEADKGRFDAQSATQVYRQDSLEHEMDEARADVDMGLDVYKDVAPSTHPATSALYIRNLMRPLRPQAVKDYLVELAATGNLFDGSIIHDFHLDQIRTHVLVVFRDVASASRVRSRLHERIWPDETNRKPLWVDFVPPDSVPGWIETETDSSSMRSSANRYEVLYSKDDNGHVTARLEEVSNIPTAPRASQAQFQHNQQTANGWQASRTPFEVNNAPASADLDMSDRLEPDPIRREHMSYSTTTRANPPVPWQPVTDALVDRRRDAIAAVKTTKHNIDFGKNYHRYFFEHGSTFVDRGVEHFLGIRPPHRERERRRELADRRRGPGGGSRGSGRGPLPEFPHRVPRGGDRYRGQASGSYSSTGRSLHRDDGRYRSHHLRDSRY